MKTFLFTAACVLLAAAAGPAQTSTKAAPKPAAGLGKTEAASNEETNIRAYIELLRTDVRKSKSEVMAAVMQLDANQATKFWPIYKEFEDDYTKVGDRIVVIVREFGDNYDTLTDAGADKLATQVLDIEQQRNDLKKKYYARIKESLGGITAMRFLQVENQLERLIDLQIAAQLPIAGER